MTYMDRTIKNYPYLNSLKAFCEQKRISINDTDKIRDYIEGELSPEWLHEDGEIKPSVARQKGKKLNALLAELQIGNHNTRSRSNDMVNEINRMPDGYHEDVTEKIGGRVGWKNKNLKRIVRLRLLSDAGFPAWDVSYCHGEMKDGTMVDVELPFSQLPKKDYRKAIVVYAQKDKVYAKGLEIFSAISTLI